MSYPTDEHFASLVGAASAAADAHQRELKRKRGDEDSYFSTPLPNDLPTFHDQPKAPTLLNSAAVLFREPSEKSKKYSRPPLGKVFTSLELAPDGFLKLQSAAKDYMLSDEYPERKDVVGHKKQNGNNDQAKLKLYQCVNEFLEQNGNGEIFFGHSTNANDLDAPLRTFFWPEDRSRIIKLLMPLLRKMVTNERQRLYAAESRKSDTKKPTSNGQVEDGLSDDEDPNQTSLKDAVPQIDPSLQLGAVITSVADTIPSPLPPTVPDVGTINLLVNIITRDNEETKHMEPEFTLSSEKAGSFGQFVENIKSNLEIDMNARLDVKALLPQGLTSITTEEEWLNCQVGVLMTLWMNSRVTLIVEV